MKLLRWMQEIKRFLPVKPQFILWGNIFDVYPFFSGENSPPVTLKLRDFLKNSLKSFANFTLFLEYSPLLGFRLLEGDAEVVKKITGVSVAQDKPAAASLIKASEILEKLVQNQEVHVVILMNIASRYKQLEREEVFNEFFVRLFALSHDATPKLLENPKDPFPIFNPIFWLVDRENDFPDWYCINNVRVRSVSIPKPDYEVRKIVIQALCRHLQGFYELPAEKRTTNEQIFIDQTNNMFSSEIISIVQLAKTENMGFEEIGEAIKRYRVGVIENPWAKLDIEKIKKAESILSERVKGQELAVKKSSEIIRRAVFNLSGSQYSAFSMRPKGVLFFAGPTGVGKTELAKAITEMLFGSESNYLRFDMSEFGHEHSDQRLVGAPPGYVGYDVGGQLTNAIKQNPFSVILFDEIEKAHSKILDIFLQILDDGRLTSGRGETVYFTEALIIFTSNLGIYEMKQDGTKLQKVHPEMPYEKITIEVKEAIEDFFKYKIGRPEILNRIGENIVVFDFIREAIGKQILTRMISNVKQKLRENSKISLEVSPETFESIVKFCTKDLSMGGRGVGNKLEAIFINSLSSALFFANAKEGQTFLVHLDQEKGIKLEKKC